VDVFRTVGPYRIERLLGVGSFATVWLGHDAALGSHVAIKVLADNWSHDLRVRERFLEEARILWRLDHERLVRVHGLGELDDGRPYLLMAWADRGSLRDRLAGGPLPVTEAAAGPVHRLVLRRHARPQPPPAVADTRLHRPLRHAEKDGDLLVRQVQHVAQGDRLGQVGADPVQRVQQVQPGAGDHAGAARIRPVGQRGAGRLGDEPAAQRPVCRPGAVRGIW
jgi:hypothetical protein